MSPDGPKEPGRRKLLGLEAVLLVQDSTFLEYSRSSPGALILSRLDAGLRISEDVVLNKGAEFDGDVSPEALPMPA